MALSIINKMAADGGSVYYDQGWRDNVEMHLPYLLAQPNNRVLPLLDSDTEKYRFDFYGLLFAYNIPASLHYIILRMNGLTATSDYSGQLLSLLVPDAGVVQGLLSVWQATTQKVKKIA